MRSAPRPHHTLRAPRLPPPPEHAFCLPRPRRFRLANGLPVLLLQRNELPLVHVSLVLYSGHALDPSDEPGVAFTTAALVDEGAGPRAALQIASDLQALGTALQISVDTESTTVAMDLLREQLDPALGIVADVLLRPHLDRAELQRVKAEIVSRGEHRRSDPSQVASLALSRAVFGRHPYARPALPLPSSVAGLERRQVVRFHRQHYRPNNAILVVAGDVARDELERMLVRRLSAWRGASLPRPPASRDRHRAPRLVLVDRPGSSETVLRVGHRLPARRQLDPPTVQLLNTILGGSFTSRLNANLRERNGFTYGASSFCTMMRQQGMLIAAAQVDREATVPALHEMLRELQGLTRRKVGRRELDKARALLLEELPSSAETLAGLADGYIELALYREPMDSLNQLPERLARVTSDDLLDLARRLLLPEAATLVVVGDVASIGPRLEQIYGPARLRDLDGLSMDDPV